MKSQRQTRMHTSPLSIHLDVGCLKDLVLFATREHLAYAGDGEGGDQERA